MVLHAHALLRSVTVPDRRLCKFSEAMPNFHSERTRPGRHRTTVAEFGKTDFATKLERLWSTSTWGDFDRMWPALATICLHSKNLHGARARNALDWANSAPGKAFGGPATGLPRSPKGVAQDRFGADSGLMCVGWFGADSGPIQIGFGLGGSAGPAPGKSA